MSIAWRRWTGVRRAVTVPTTEAEAAREEPAISAIPASGRPPGQGWRSHLGSLAFLAPGAIWLLVIVVYSMVVTIRDSFYDSASTTFVGLGNYKSVFSTADILIAFRNNVIWVIVFPFIVTFLGLVFAVLSERIRWSTAFKTIMFMPIVFSMTASAMVWRAALDTSPNVGMLNATLITISDWFNPPGPYAVNSATGQSLSQYISSGVRVGPGNTLVSTAAVSPGGTVKLGLIGFSATTLQLLGAKTAVEPSASAGAVAGLVWRDFSPTHPGQKGQVFPDEVGLPAMHLTLLSQGGSSVGTTISDAHGDFTFSHVPAGSYTVSIDSGNFNSGFTGIDWLGGQSVTPTRGLNQTAQSLLSVPLLDFSMIVAYLWIWAGFAMVVLGAGLAALNREVLEAARIDGATEWQTLRRVTIPMLAPVLVVVFVTMIINVIKIFDIIITMPTDQYDANTLASQVYFVGFTGVGNYGVASAIAVILFILVIPAMLLNLRRIRG